MPKLKNIRFSKDGAYGDKIFIANSQKEPETFKLLENFYNQLCAKYPDNFLPIYCNNKHKYATIRFKIDKKFRKNDIYDIEFVIKKKTSNDKTYINCYLEKAKLIKRGEEEDEGEILDLDFE